VADDINVTFGADDSALSQAIAKIKASMAQLDAGAVALGKTISEAFAKMNITQAAGFKLAGPEEQNALAQYWASLDKVGKKVDEVSQAHGKMGQATRQAGIDFGAMAERMAARMVIFEAIRLVIQGIKYAFDQISNLQQVQLQFDAMADSADNLAGKFKYLKEGWEAAFVKPEKAIAAYEALKDLGVSENTAAMATKDLDQWSQILGIDAVKLAEALGQVAEGTASLQQMRLVTRMMGEQGAAGRELVQNLVDLEKAQKALDVQSAATEKSMAAQLRATEQASAEAERHLERHLSFTEKIINAQTAWDRARGRETRTPAQVLTQAFEARGAGGGVPGSEVMMQPRGGWGGTMIPKAELEEYRRGIAAIAQEQHISQSAVHTLIQQQVLDYHDVLAAAKERTSDEMRNLTQLDQKQRDMMEAQRTAAGLAVTGAKAQIAAALPQAVTAPPTALWEQFTSSIKGSGDAVKQSIDTGIAKLVEAVGKAEKASQLTADHTESLYTLLAGGT
jgi:hypothetical protein